MFLKTVVTFIILFTLTSVISISAQTENDTTKYWTIGGIPSVTFSQVTFNNWAAGGENSLSLLGSFDAAADYAKDKHIWENRVSLNYGLLKQGGEEFRKTDDRIYLGSKYGSQATEKWYYTALLSFESQFQNGYDFSGDTTKNKISAPFAPAYILGSLGMNYKAFKGFDVFISPATGKMTIVADNDLSAAGAFGVNPGSNLRTEMGGFLKIAFEREIFKNVRLVTRVDFFSNYFEKPQNIDINGELKVNMKVNDILSANFALNMIYDDDIDINGGPKTQVKQVFGVGISYIIGEVKPKE